MPKPMRPQEGKTGPVLPTCGDREAVSLDGEHMPLIPLHLDFASRSTLPPASSLQPSPGVSFYHSWRPQDKWHLKVTSPPGSSLLLPHNPLRKALLSPASLLRCSVWSPRALGVP